MLNTSPKSRRLTLQLKADILNLLETLREQQAAAGKEPISDTEASKACFHNGEFVSDLRHWQGGAGGPTLEMTLEFETFLTSRIDPEGDKAGASNAASDEKSRLWLLENSSALASSNDYVRQKGLPLAKYRVI